MVGSLPQNHVVGVTGEQGLQRRGGCGWMGAEHIWQRSYIKDILLLILLLCLFLSPLNNPAFLREIQIKEFSASCEIPVPRFAHRFDLCCFLYLLPSSYQANDTRKELFIKSLNKRSAQHPTTLPFKEFSPRLGSSASSFLHSTQKSPSRCMLNPLSLRAPACHHEATALGAAKASVSDKVGPETSMQQLHLSTQRAWSVTAPPLQDMYL